MNPEKNSMPLVSVIIPVYNSEQFICEAVDSVLNQTYTNLQIIVVNDASTDNTLKLLSEYQDSRIQIITLTQNMHAAYARNMALPHVKGKYIAFLDADDLWYPTKIEKQVHILENNAQYCACFTWAYLIDENNNRVIPYDESTLFLHNAFHVENLNQKECLLYFLTKGNYINSCSSLIRTDVIKKIGGQNLSLIQLHDFEHWIRLVSYGEIYMLCEELTIYRRIRNGQSISASNTVTRIRSENEMVYIYKHFFDYISDDKFVELFQDMFQCSDSHTPDELKCEKVFLLKNVHLSMEPFLCNIQDLLSNESTAFLLIERYGYTPNDFYAANIPFRYFSMFVEDRIMSLTTQIQTIQNSLRWRCSSIIANIINKLFRRYK